MKLYDLLSSLTDKKTPICVSSVIENGDVHTIYPAINADALLAYSFLFEGNDDIAWVGVGNGCLEICLKEVNNGN